ncbi:MAG: type II toxin-antitoxin system HicB family antitoxin [Chloroflexi bacterium]|nr:type II toxin-antitoxin system HicB family antitoxin [Chloroflexota bacterium]
MKHEFTAIIEHGETFLIATCPEVPEAHGQGMTREECLRDLVGSIQSVLEYRRDEALSKLSDGAERAVVQVQ